ncbi:MAG: CDP-diacylglycerol--glycerol-3-phosphate 3-phosphatidyltransferase [Clostridia bacterium]
MNVITLATKITIARIFLIVPTMIVFVAGMLLGSTSTAYLPLLITACILFSLLCATDFIDGGIARKTHTVSDLGKFLDPLADKIVVVIMLYLIVFFNDGLDTIFAYNGIVIALLSSIIVSRELIISVFRSVAAKKNIVMAADIYGKFKTIFLDVGVACLIIAGLHPVMAWLGTIIFYIGGVLAIVSGVNYVVKNKQVFAPVDETAEENKAEKQVADAKNDTVNADTTANKK